MQSKGINSQGGEIFARLAGGFLACLAGGGPDRLSFVGGRAALILASFADRRHAKRGDFCGNICDFGLRAVLVFFQKV